MKTVVRITANYYRIVKEGSGTRLEKREASITDTRDSITLKKVQRIIKKNKPEGEGWKIQSFGWDILGGGDIK